MSRAGDDEESPKKVARVDDVQEERFQRYLENYYRRYQEKFPSIRMSTPDIIFINGRFHGLWPGDSAADFYGGHPGLFYHMLVNAISLGTTNVFVMMSKTYEGPGTKYPIEPETKHELIQRMFELLKRKLPENIIQFSDIPQEDRAGFIRWLNEKIDAVDVTIENLTFPAGNLENYIGQLGIPSPTAVMITGLEEKISKPTKKNPEQTVTWFNKYEKSFDKLVKEGKLGSIEFILLPREGGISGTIIRQLIQERKYDELGRLLVQAGFKEEDFDLFGQIILAHKGDTASQDAPGYTESLKQKFFDFLDSQTIDEEEEEKEDKEESKEGKGGSKTKRHRKRSRKTKQRKLKTKRRKYSKHRRNHPLL